MQDNPINSEIDKKAAPNSGEQTPVQGSQETPTQEKPLQGTSAGEAKRKEIAIGDQASMDFVRRSAITEQAADDADQDDAFKVLDVWINFQAIAEAQGLPLPPHVKFSLTDEVNKFREAWVVIVVGIQPLHVQYVAETFALERSRGCDCRRGTMGDFVNLTYEELIDLLQRKSERGRALVINVPLNDFSVFLRNRTELKKAIMGRKNFRLIFGVTHLSPESLEDLDNVSVIELPSVLEHNPGRATSDREHYRKVLGSGLTSLAEVIGAKNYLIEQHLVRIGVLFGNLTPSHLEKLMRMTLGSPTIRLTEWNEGRQPELALDLWESNRTFFRERAGMSIGDDGKLGFAPWEAGEAAAEAAWTDPEAMVSIFQRLDAVELLFSRERESSTLFERVHFSHRFTRITRVRQLGRILAAEAGHGLQSARNVRAHDWRRIHLENRTEIHHAYVAR